MDGDELVLADFGFVKFITLVKRDEMTPHSGWLSTVAYMSPQLLAEEAYSDKCDV